MSPKRIQMSRQEPWREANPDAIVVSRPNALGNPYKVEPHCKGKHGDWHVVDTGRFMIEVGGHGWTKQGAAKVAVTAYRKLLDEVYPEGGHARWILVQNFRGHDLACWCPLDQPCHADVLLELANGVTA